MLAAYADHFDSDDPLNGLRTGQQSEPDVPDGWISVSVRAAALNHHDVWSLRGVGLRKEQLPMILGCDAAGLDEDGNEVIVHAVVGDPGATTAEPTLARDERPRLGLGASTLPARACRRLEDHDVATTVAATLNYRSARLAAGAETAR